MFDFLKNPLYIVALLTILTVLVAAHELGHYLFARWFKMAVEEFAIGFGNPKWVWKRKKYLADGTPESEHETIFTLRPLPLGGFVRIAGMQPQEDGSETQVRDGFYSKSPFARWMVLFAGPLFSYLAGMAILVPLFVSQGMERFSTQPVIGSVSPSQSAYQAGIRAGDKIISLDGRPVNRFFDITSHVRDRAEIPIAVVYERQGEERTTTMVPVKDTEPTPVMNEAFEQTQASRVQGKIGIMPSVERVPMTVGAAVWTACNYPVKMVDNLIGIIRSPNRFKNEMGGPILIANFTAKAVDDGMERLLNLAGLLSISLGILNLIMPFPPFDGGQMVIAFLEMLRRGRRISYRVQEVLFGTGTLAALALFVAVMWADIRRFTLPRTSATPTQQSQTNEKSKPPGVSDSKTSPPKTGN